MKRRIVIVGGGIAGLSSAWALAKRSASEVILLEREGTLCEHASGHNAAIFRPLELDSDLAALASESLDAFQRLASPEGSLVDARGFVLLHRERAHLLAVKEASAQGGIPSELLDAEGLAKVLGHAAPPARYHGLLAPSGGIIDIHALAQALAREARRLGVRISEGVEVSALSTESGRVCGVRTKGSETLPADAVVVAGGAWCAKLGEAWGVPLPLTPVRRHLAVLEPERPLDRGFPVVWCLDPEVYFRPELERVLASPCDALAVDSTVAQAEIEALSPLWEKLAQLRMGLESARVSRHWACLRTFAPDNRPVIGPDPRLEGLYWLGGLGGFGMTTGVAAGEELARVMYSEPGRARFPVARLLVT